MSSFLPLPLYLFPLEGSADQMDFFLIGTSRAQPFFFTFSQLSIFPQLPFQLNTNSTLGNYTITK